MQTKRFYKITNDMMFQTIFTDIKNRDLLERLIEEVIGVKVKIKKLLIPRLVKDNIRIKGKTLDIIAETEQGEINIELNACMYDYLHRRNACYIFKRYANDVDIKDSYKDMSNLFRLT